MMKKEKKIEKYFEKKKEIYDIVLGFIESTDHIENDFVIFINNIDVSSIKKNKEEFEHFLRMVSSISNNHQRKADFFTRIERIFEYFEKYIKQTFSKNEIFHIFKNNHLILLFLFKKEIITPDETYVKFLYELDEPNSPRLCHFFLPEIREFISEEKYKEIEQEMININKSNIYNYEEKRQKGENDTYLCSLIREDSIDEFISYYHKNKFQMNQKVEPSIFETNPYLIKRRPTLIEYSAFYGSIQIFNFLRLSGATLDPSLWLYSIHSKNPELIHQLENNQIYPDDDSYEECLKESIKCHHNDFSLYIKDNLMTPTNSKERNDIQERIDSYGIKYYNYSFFPKQFNENYLFYYMTKYNYSKYVNFFIGMNKNEIEQMTIDNNYDNNKLLEESAKNNKIYIIYDFLSQRNKIYEECFLDCNFLKEITIPRSIESIERCSFYECKSLYRIFIPSTVKNIGSYAFFGCSLLTEIELPTSLESIGKYVFNGCSSLTKIKIPPKITRIEECCFYGCKSLTHISIPSSIRIIEHHAFYECLSLQKIQIPSMKSPIEQSLLKKCKSLSEVIIEKSFDGCSSLTQITIPSSVTSIEDSVFFGCSSLTQITIPSSVTSIRNSAFFGCSLLSQITIPSSVTSIGNSAFSLCSSLTQITIPSSVTSIGVGAFSVCSSLSQITIPSSVTSIGNSAFFGCRSLTQITIPSSVTLIENSTFESCSSLTQIIIPSFVSSIGDSAFKKCSSLTQITIPSSVSSIGKSAFFGCRSLTQITIPSSVTSIEDSSFKECSSLAQIAIPFSVNSIGESAFSGCSLLTQITIPSSVTSIRDYAFSGCSSLPPDLIQYISNINNKSQ